MNSRFVNFDKRQSADFSHVEFFVNRYPGLLPYESAAEINKLKEEFSTINCWNVMKFQRMYGNQL